MLEKIKKSNWKDLLWSIAIMCGAIFIYFYLTEQENSGESFRTNAIIVLLYTFLGKFYTSLIVFLFGVWMLYDYIKANFYNDKNKTLK